MKPTECRQTLLTEHQPIPIPHHRLPRRCPWRQCQSGAVFSIVIFCFKSCLSVCLFHSVCQSACLSVCAVCQWITTTHSHTFCLVLIFRIFFCCCYALSLSLSFFLFFHLFVDPFHFYLSSFLCFFAVPYTWLHMSNFPSDDVSLTVKLVCVCVLTLPPLLCNLIEFTI